MGDVRIMLRKLLMATALAVALIVTPVVTQSSTDEKVVCISETKTEREIIVNGMVTEDTFVQFMQATSDRNVTHFIIHINTSGGSAFALIGMMTRINEMKKRNIKFTTVNSTKALSAGAYLFLMGDERIAYEGSTFMFHTMMQQVKDYQESYIETVSPSSVAMIRRLDEWARKRFKEVTNCGEATANYYLNGVDSKGYRIAQDEGMQYMSGLTAYNLNVATQYREF